jgi:hypothetical protein
VRFLLPALALCSCTDSYWLREETAMRLAALPPEAREGRWVEARREDNDEVVRVHARALRMAPRSELPGYRRASAKDRTRLMALGVALALVGVALTAGATAAIVDAQQTDCAQKKSNLEFDSLSCELGRNEEFTLGGTGLAVGIAGSIAGLALLGVARTLPSPEVDRTMTRLDSPPPVERPRVPEIRDEVEPRPSNDPSGARP